MASYTHVIAEDFALDEETDVFNMPVLLENLTLADAISAAKGGIITDSLTVSDVLAVVPQFNHVVAEDLELSETIAGQLTITAITSESSTLAETLTGNQILTAIVSESAVFTMSFSYDGHTYTGLVLNTKNNARSEYTGFDFNSMAGFGDDYYGAKADGIYLMGGGLDVAGLINSKITGRLDDFGSDMLKRVEYAYFGVRNDGDLVIKLTVREYVGGAKTEYWYTLTDTSDSIRNTRTKIGKGLRARYWQFELVNNGGEDFELDDISLFPVVLTRRV